MIHDSSEDIETASPGLRLGACGWKQDTWSAGFYPEDLPDDWRLTYYANEFSTVLVPEADWRDAAEPEQWLEDVPEDFGFYLQAADGNTGRLREVAEALGEQFAGIVAERPVAGIEPELQYCHQPGSEGARGIWTPENPVTSPLAMVSLAQSDIRAWRSWLEQFGRHNPGHTGALLVSDDRVDMQQLQQLKTLLELMGF